MIHDNVAAFQGGGIMAVSSTATLTNNTITQNVPLPEYLEESFGSGITVSSGGILNSLNDIIYDNEAANQPEIYNNGSTVNCNYACCSQSLLGTGNITEDPRFVDREHNNFNLLAYSPCIDAGSPTSPLDPDSTRADMGTLYFDQNGGGMNVPNVPTNFTVEHNNAILIASLSWVNPSVAVNQQTLLELQGVRVYRNEELIATLTNVSIGLPSSYDDNTVPTAGMYEYELQPYNSYGTGAPGNASAWIGLDVPGEPGNVTATPDPGYELECIISWEAPTEGAHNGYWVAGSWTGQKIYRNGDEIADLAGTHTSYIDNSVPGHGFYIYGVSYYNASGEGVIGECLGVPVGPPEYEEIPYEWVELTGIGTNTGITGDDETLGPFDIGFGFPYFDDVIYHRVWVCSNGWITLSPTSMSTFTNFPLPDPGEPNNMICPYWDDLSPGTVSRVFYHYDAANNRFIVEYSNLSHFSTGGNYTFEIIFYPNGYIDFMYNDLTHGTSNSATVGIENQDGTRGIQVTYDGSGTLNPRPEMGIRVYAQPPSGAEEGGVLPAIPRVYALHPAYPNPFNPVTNICFDLPEPGQVSLIVYDVLGRQAARVVDGWYEAGSYRRMFNAGNLSSGVYFVRMTTASYQKTQKLLLIK